VSGSGDGTLRIWDPESGDGLLALQGDGSSVNSVAWSPDGSRIVSGSKSGQVRIWDSQREVARVRWRRQGLEEAATLLLEPLFTDLLLPDLVQVALEQDPTLSPELRASAHRLADGWPTSHLQLNSRAWERVDPDGSEPGDLSHALAWARAAVEANPDRARYRQTLAWACSASGLDKEALEQLQRALDLEGSALRRRGLREDLERLRAQLDGDDGER